MNANIQEFFNKNLALTQVAVNKYLSKVQLSENNLNFW